MSHIIDIVSKDSQSILSLYNSMSHIFYTKGEPMNHVKDYRLLLGISQLDLAKAIGVSRQTINMIENNKYNPSLDLCINLAKALQTDLNSLFWNEQKGKYHEKEYTSSSYLYPYFYPALCPLSALGQQRSRNLAHHQPLLWFLFAGFVLTFSIVFFAGKIQPLHAGFWGMSAILLFYKQLKK